MDMQVKQEGRCLEIFLKGEMDHHGAKGLIGRLDSEIALALPLRLILDMEGISFMDSSGIAVVMRARQRMQEMGGHVKLCRVPLQALRVLDAAGISRMVEIDERRRTYEK